MHINLFHCVAVAHTLTHGADWRLGERMWKNKEKIAHVYDGIRCCSAADQVVYMLNTESVYCSCVASRFLLAYCVTATVGPYTVHVTRYTILFAQSNARQPLPPLLFLIATEFRWADTVQSKRLATDTSEQKVCGLRCDTFHIPSTGKP